LDFNLFTKKKPRTSTFDMYSLIGFGVETG
jgi:hypothetical protein